MVKHELLVTSYKLRVESLKARAEIQKCKFKSKSYEFESTSYVFESTSYELESSSYESKPTSYEFESMSDEFQSTSYKFKSTNHQINKYSRNSLKRFSFTKILSPKLFGNPWLYVQFLVIISLFMFPLLNGYGFNRKLSEQTLDLKEETQILHRKVIPPMILEKFLLEITK